MLIEQTGWRDWRTPVTGLITVPVTNALGDGFKDSAGSFSGAIGVPFALLFRARTEVAVLVCSIWFTPLAFSSHAVKD